MFDMGITEMLLIGIVALVVIGPERLPGVARTAGKYFSKLRNFMTSVRADVESELRADELREMFDKQKEELQSLKEVVSEVGNDIGLSDIANSISDTEPEATPKPKTDAITRPKPKARPKSRARVKPKTKVEAKAKAKAKPKARPKAKASAKSKAVPKKKASLKTKAEAETRTKLKPRSAAKSKTKSRAKSTVKKKASTSNTTRVIVPPAIDTDSNQTKED